MTNSTWQLRVDVWSSIADLTKRLADPTAPTTGPAGPARELGELLGLVAPIENYWAVPGPERVGELRRLYTGGDYEALVAAVEPIARLMVGTYRPASGNDRRSRCSSSVGPGSTTSSCWIPAGSPSTSA